MSTSDPWATGEPRAASATRCQLMTAGFSAVNEVFRTPLVSVGREGNVSGSDGWTHGTTEFSRRMDEEQSVTVLRNLPFKITMQRYTDKDARKINAITLDDGL
ncbi:MAG: hypothetical protein U0Z70_15235 [Thermomicrobiales bacterium]